MNIYLVDDNTSFRENLKTFIEGFLHYKVVGEASNGNEFIENYKNNSDIVLMDINMPGLDGIKTTKLSTWTDRSTKIIAVSQYASIDDLQQLVESGFKGFVSKTRLFDDLNNAIQKVHAGGLYFH